MYSRRLRSGTDDQKALYRQQDLEQRLATLINHAERDAPSLKNGLQLLQADAAVISKYFSDTMDTKLYNERRPPSTTDVAVRAFAIPEILEMILDELEHNELLESRLVSRQFRDTIKASPNLGFRVMPPRLKVKKRSGPRINIDGNINGVNWTRECRLCRVDRDHGHSRYHRHCAKEVWVEVEDLPRMVPWRCFDIQVCDPPVYDMKIWVNCCSSPQYDGHYECDPFDHISNEQGITLRNLLDKAKELQVEHAFCDLGQDEDEDYPDDFTSGYTVVTFAGDHGFVCEECDSDKSCACCEPPYFEWDSDDPDGDNPPESDDDTHTDEEDAVYHARLLTNRNGRR